MSASPPDILILGADGQLGWELRRTLATLGRLHPATLDGRHGYAVDLSKGDALRDLVRRVAPRLVINAAAYTAVDRAEEEREMARLVNGVAPGVIGEAAREADATVIHFSTDYVFPGDASTPYRETDEVGPLNVYGETKLEGERALLESGADAAVFRTSWVYGLRGANFLLTMRRLMAERQELRVVSDQVGAPTWSRMLAEAVAQVVARLAPGGYRFDELGGLYHMTSAGSTSWHGFAEAIRQLDGAACRVLPIPSDEYPTPARRPASSLLDNGRLADRFGIRLPDWFEALRLCMEEDSGAA